MEKKSKKKYLIGALAVLLVAVAVGGTIAWLTASDKVVNNFTVGEINPPDQEENVPQDPDDPDETSKFSGNIYEIFANDPKIIPGSSVTKTPYIGVGNGGEDAYVFAYVDNDMMSVTSEPSDAAYFTLGEGWKPVDATFAGPDGSGYKAGLFVWCGDGDDPTPLASKSEGETTDPNNWTGALFDKVVIPESAQASDFKDEPVMTVYCFLYADVNDTTYAEAEQAARDWAQAGKPGSQGTATTE